MGTNAFSIALVALVASAVLHGAAAQVTSGCSAVSAATVAKGFFTMNSKCYSMYRNDAPGSSGSCTGRCATGGMACLGTSHVVGGTASDCSTLIDAYLESSANEAGISSSGGLPFDLCGLVYLPPWGRGNTASGMPVNAVTQCDEAIAAGSAVLSCECVEAPLISGVSASQASSSTVTVTGTTDTAGYVYCVVDVDGTSYVTGDVATHAMSYRASVSAGSFTVTVPDVSGEGSMTAACVGEHVSNGARSLTPAVSTSFAFGTCPPQRHTFPSCS